MAEEKKVEVVAKATEVKTEAPAKKATTKKSPAKKATTKKPVAKKSPAKKATAKKPAAKKVAPAKKAVAKKPVAKKAAPAKKAATKKPAAKKAAPAKKPAVKKVKKLGKVIFEIEGKQIDYKAIEKKAAKLGGNVYVVVSEKKIFDADGKSVDLF